MNKALLGDVMAAGTLQGLWSQGQGYEMQEGSLHGPGHEPCGPRPSGTAFMQERCHTDPKNHSEDSQAWKEGLGSL